MENISSDKQPELEQPDFLMELDGANAEPKLPLPKKDLKISPLFEAGDKYVCPTCKNGERLCENCHGRNYGYEPKE